MTVTIADADDSEGDAASSAGGADIPFSAASCAGESSGGAADGAEATYEKLSDAEAEAAEDGDVFPTSLHRLSQQLYLDSDEDDDDLPELPAETLTPEEASNRKCYKIAHEMLTTEQSYVQSLQLIEDLFIEQLNAARANKKEIIPMDVRDIDDSSLCVFG